MGKGVRGLAMVVGLSGCGTSGDDGAGHDGGPADTADELPACTALFGRPTPASGLSDAQCGPRCPCIDWDAPDYDAAAVAELAAFTLLEEVPTLDADPYADPDPPSPRPDAVCGVLVEAGGYRLRTFDDADLAADAGAKVTHYGACGVCSTLRDLSVYIGTVDLTAPVRACGVAGIGGGDEANLECLLDLGFTMPCAQIWLYNTKHTRQECLDVCLDLLDAPYHLPDGALNACLQCDEDRSGAVFKAVAGRTRRNSGLATALCRPCDEVRPIEHAY